jgi:hypothetical protein
MTTICLLFSRPRGSKVWTIHHHTPFKTDDHLESVAPGSRHIAIPACKNSRCNDPLGKIKAIEQDAMLEGLETHIATFDIPD